MVAATEQPLLREYDDGPDWPITNRAKEQAYRQGFLEGARHVVKVWAHPPGPPKPDPQPVSVRKPTVLASSELGKPSVLVSSE